VGQTDIKLLLKVEGLCMHAHNNQLYKQVKKRGDVRYLKCYFDHCDGSAKLQDGEMSVGVSEHGRRSGAVRPLRNCADTVVAIDR